ncbi:hypothetical protein [Nodosilinea sp. E11]|uniref:hypothetical protein n=1 Tax=Nodosilinea sp. E11 TaxID=3037479 RepID=UPI0029352B78|nr:hypothetical protein [Nodosilinea sp. E11]WOD37427.1 hypothetical protein RRF56_14550 [Nodosilinea sp. E11]
MSAALKSYVPRPVPSRRRTATARTRASLRHGSAVLSAQVQPRPPQRVSPPVVLPTPPSLDKASPAVRLLSQVHLVSSALSVALLGLTLVSYGTSVYVNHQLSQANRQLNRLQRSEQQLTNANEMLKNHLAQQVEVSAMGFQPPQPGNVIFLKPAQPTAAVALPSQGSTSALGRFALPKVDVPLGY